MSGNGELQYTLLYKQKHRSYKIATHMKVLCAISDNSSFNLQFIGCYLRWSSMGSTVKEKRKV